MEKDDNLYRLIPEEGKHLANSHDTEGAYRGVYLDDETNKPCGAGEFVKVDLDDSDDRENPAEDNSESSAGTLIGIGIAIGATLVAGLMTAYPHVKKWVVEAFIPKLKRCFAPLRGEDTMATEDDKQRIADGTDSSSIVSLPSIDKAWEGYRENMTSEEAQKELLEAFILYAQSFKKMRRIAHANIIGATGNITDGYDMLSKLTNVNLLENINTILSNNPSLLEERQLTALSEILGHSDISVSSFSPITAEALIQSLMGTSA